LEEHLENLLDPETDSISTVFSVDLFEIFNNEKELMDFARAELENILDDLNKLDETQAYKYVTDDINEPWYVCRFRIVENNSTTK
jgi:DNA-binding protein Fis